MEMILKQCRDQSLDMWLAVEEREDHDKTVYESNPHSPVETV